MEQKKFSKVIFFLIVIAVFVSITGTFLLMNALNTNDVDELEVKSSSSGEISLNILNEPNQEYSSTGMISLKLVEKE